MLSAIDNMRESYDWQHIFTTYADPEAVTGYKGSTAAFTLDDVAQVVASDDGENDGAEWIAILRLNDGRFAYLYAGCDYTGWG